jgi:hypothetical protein
MNINMDDESLSPPLKNRGVATPAKITNYYQLLCAYAPRFTT